MSTPSGKDVAIAMALVMGAGAATALGAMVVFFPSLVKHAKRKTLAAALGLSSGVMTYVSFAEIFQKSVDAFGETMDEKKAYSYATLCFFGGVIAMITLNHGVTALLGGHHHHHHSSIGEDAEARGKTNTESRDSSNKNIQTVEDDTNDTTTMIVQPPCCSENPRQNLEKIHQMADVLLANDDDDDEPSSNDDEEGGTDHHANNSTEENEKLMRMSINTALAIALHNFPEGLATFVATLNDPKVGAVLAAAIAIHNIPEGLCVALPIFYATGNRGKAFMWGVLSGVSEPVAALLGWVILANVVSDIVYAVLFGLVAGMMVIISVRELLPTAHRYDPEDTVVTNSFIFGMAIMALSLVLFVV